MASLRDFLSNGSVLQDLGAPFFVKSNVLNEQKLADSTKAADQLRASPRATDGALPGMLKRAKTGKHERQQEDRSQPAFPHAEKPSVEPSEVSAKRAKQSFSTEQRIDLNSLPSAVRIVLVKSHHHETLGRLMGVGVRVRGQFLDTSKTAIPISTTMSAAAAVAMAHAAPALGSSSAVTSATAAMQHADIVATAMSTAAAALGMKHTSFSKPTAVPLHLAISAQSADGSHRVNAACELVHEYIAEA
eukprot:jgi/Chrpa1/26229/Chrysochromulina_OHIO_Genome00011544-RA